MNEFDFVKELLNKLSEYQIETGNCNKDSIVVCITKEEYYIIELYINYNFDIDSPYIEPNQFQGIQLITSDNFINTPFVAEKGKPVIP